MIYFIQDTSVLNIKVGYTGGEALDRLKSLQTGSPVGLVLLGTTEGDQRRERELHERFAAARVQGEWFRPVPELIQYVMEATRPKLVAPTPTPVPVTDPWPLHIYLAGKISKNCWRHTIVSGLCNALPEMVECPAEGPTSLPPWPVLHGSILNTHHYVGPFFAGCDHGCFHGDDSHGVAASVEYKEEIGGHMSTWSRREDVVRACLGAVKRADVVFAWIDSPDCYGSIVELGYAAALGKPLWIAGPRPYRDMWFLHEAAECFFAEGWSPRTVLTHFLEHNRLATPDRIQHTNGFHS